MSDERECAFVAWWHKTYPSLKPNKDEREALVVAFDAGWDARAGYSALPEGMTAEKLRAIAHVLRRHEMYIPIDHDAAADDCDAWADSLARRDT